MMISPSYHASVILLSTTPPNLSSSLIWYWSLMMPSFFSISVTGEELRLKEPVCLKCQLLPIQSTICQPLTAENNKITLLKVCLRN